MRYVALHNFIIMHIRLIISFLLLTVTLVWAVPSEINYQGRLTDANGDAVTGDVTMSLKMFDAATEGNEIYSEDIGTVTLDSNGVYSFEFGASGQSVVSTSELIATTDGTNSIFNATLENLPVDGSISVSDGTYTWSQANGSSSSTEFTASVTPLSGAVSAIYMGNTPTSSVDITASYNYLDATVSGALSSHANHWLELSVDGTAQSPRERVLSVPFAQAAIHAQLADELVVKSKTRINLRSAFVISSSTGWENFPSILTIPVALAHAHNSNNTNLQLRIPLDTRRISKIYQIKANVDNTTANSPGSSESFGRSTVSLYKIDGTGSVLLADGSLDRVSGDILIDHVVDLDESFEYHINLDMSLTYSQSNGSVHPGTSTGINSIEITCDSR